MGANDPRVNLDLDSLFEQANQNALVRAKVQDRAAQIAARARRIDQAENEGRANISTEFEVLPNGRFMARVVSDDVSGEFGDSVTKRRRTLRRSAGRRR